MLRLLRLRSYLRVRSTVGIRQYREQPKKTYLSHVRSSLTAIDERLSSHARQITLLDKVRLLISSEARWTLRLVVKRARYAHFHLIVLVT